MHQCIVVDSVVIFIPKGRRGVARVQCRFLYLYVFAAFRNRKVAEGLQHASHLSPPRRCASQNERCITRILALFRNSLCIHSFQHSHCWQLFTVAFSKRFRRFFSIAETQNRYHSLVSRASEKIPEELSRLAAQLNAELAEKMCAKANGGARGNRPALASRPLFRLEKSGEKREERRGREDVTGQLGKKRSEQTAEYSSRRSNRRASRGSP